jgi:type II secretory pathway predicted ATPase ExeA
MTTTLRDARKAKELTLAQLGEQVGLTTQQLSRIETHHPSRVQLCAEKRLRLLELYGVGPEELAHCPEVKGKRTPVKLSPAIETEKPMFEDRVTLTKDEMKRLNLVGDPFPERPHHGKFFWWPALSNTLEKIEEDLFYSRMVALVGPSGAGKSSVLAQVRENLEEAGDTIIVDLASTDRSRLTDWTVEMAILKALGQSRGKVPSSATDRLELLIRLLSKSAREGKKLALLCDDFHDVNNVLLKQLRRLREADARNALFGAVLSGQPHLASALRSEELREVGGRTQLVEMPRMGGLDHQGKPLPNVGLAYIKWSYEQLGMEAERHFSPEAAHLIAEIAEHPLWVRNLATRALKELASRGVGGRPVDPGLLHKLVRRS